MGNTFYTGSLTPSSGGGGSSYTAGNPIYIDTGNVIKLYYDSAKGLYVSGQSLAVRVDGSTLKFDQSGSLAVDDTTVALKSDLSALRAAVEAQADLITQLFYRVNTLENSINGGNSNLAGTVLPNPSSLMMMSPNSFQGLSLSNPDLEINDLNINSEDNINPDKEEDI